MWGVFFINVAGLQAADCIKKGLQHRYFLVNIGKFIRTPILKNIYERLLLSFWKLFCKNILQILNFHKTKMKGCSNPSRLNKNVSHRKVLCQDSRRLTRNFSG